MASLHGPIEWPDASRQANASQCLQCLCAAAMTGAPAAWWAALDVGPHRASLRAPDGSAPCSAQALALVQFSGLQAAAIIVVVLFNALMAATISMLARFERHHTLADQERSIAAGVFVGQFINTLIVALVVYAQIQAISSAIAYQLGSAAEWVPIFSGPFGDFTDQWYAMVGAQVLTTVLLNAITPVFPLILAALANCCLPLTARYAVTQRALNRSYEGGVFELATRYGFALNTVFVCLALSSGIPILLLVGALILTITYWIDRVYLLRLCRVPPMYSARLNDAALASLPYAALLHLLMGCWVFSAQYQAGGAMFPRPVSTNAQIISESAKALAASGQDCATLTTLAACTAASGAGCLWDTAGDGACLLDPGAAGPLVPVPRLFNDLTFPYLLVTVITAAGLVLSWTPLWPVLLGLIGPPASFLLAPLRRVWRELSGANYRVAPDALDRAAERKAAQARAAAELTYERAVREGLFGSFPATYDLTTIPPYAEILSMGANRDLFLGLLTDADAATRPGTALVGPRTQPFTSLGDTATDPVSADSREEAPPGGT